MPFPGTRWDMMTSVANPASMRGVWSMWAATRALFGVGLLVVHAAVPAALPADVAVVYFHAAQELVHGQVPYLNFSYEYPPGSLPVLALAWLLGGHTPQSYVVVWALLMLGVDALIVGRLTRLQHGRHAALAWIFGIALIGPMALLRNDLLVVASFVLALGLTNSRGNLLGGAAWAFGALTKLWPIAPLAALLLLRRRGRAELAWGAGAVFGFAAIVLVSQVALGAMLSNLFQRQGQRPIEIETIWATPVWLGSLVSGRPVRVVHTFGSFNLVGGQLFTGVATALTAAVAVACVLTPVLLARLGGVPATAPVLAWTFGLYVSASLLVAPVLSAQFALWLLGAACALLGVTGRPAASFVAATLVACGLTQLVFPVLFTQLQHGAPAAILVVVLRNVTLLVVSAIGVAGLRRAAADTHAATSTR